MKKKSTLKAPTIKPIRTGKNKKPSVNYSNETDILASFEIKNTNLTPSEAARMLSNAANGTWTEHSHNTLVSPETPRVRPILFTETGTKKITVDLAFPHTYVESGSIPSLISVIGAAMVGTGAKLIDIRIPTVLVRTFQTPSAGIDLIREGSTIHGRPLLSATMRPMTGLTPKQYAATVYDMLANGIDITCDPTMMHSLPEHAWRERTILCSRAVQEASEESGNFCTHMVNVSANTAEEMLKRAQFSIDNDLNYLLVDSASVGFSALQSLTIFARENGAVVAAMGARSMQTLAMSEQVLAKILRFIGCDIISIPSPINDTKLTSRREVKGVITALTKQDIPAEEATGLSFDQPTCSMKATMPACGGGHNPWHFPRLIDATGADCIIQCGANVMAHPDGVCAGAIANRIAVEALVKAKDKGVNLAVDGKKVLTNTAKDCSALKVALKHWKEGAFLFGVINGSYLNEEHPNENHLKNTSKNIQGTVHESS